MGEATGKSGEDLKQKLSQHIDEAKAKLDGMKQELSSMHSEDMEAFEQRRQELRQRIDQQKEKNKKVQADIDNWKQEKTAHTKEAIGSWRQRREIKKLESRAERAEDYAADMVTVAVGDFDEAQQALLDALAARYEADSAASGAA
jgi:uncharacterized coiled-coil DUF342 family protein